MHVLHRGEQLREQPRRLRLAAPLHLIQVVRQPAAAQELQDEHQVMCVLEVAVVADDVLVAQRTQDVHLLAEDAAVVAAQRGVVPEDDLERDGRTRRKLARLPDLRASGEQ